MKKTPKFKRVIQLELNEISYPVVARLMAKNELPNFQKINRKWHFHETTSETEYDKIEPWIQWVTAHTGKTFAEHQIFRLGDAPNLKHTQIWETLSEAGIESSIIGSMNATRGKTTGGIFFSDPWALQNDTYPQTLRPLWEMISSKVKGHATTELTAKDLVDGLKACVSLKLPLKIYWKIANQIVSQKRNKLNKWRLAGIFDIFLSEIFKSVLNTTNHGYYTLFLNSVAHYQHHYWRNFDDTPFDASIQYDDIAQDHDPITYGYKIMDEIIGSIFKMVEKDKDTLVIIASGLSQEPYIEKEAIGGMNYYRLKDHEAFAGLVGLDASYEVFPLMSRDWQIKYQDERTRLEALRKLTGLTIKGQPLFNIKEDTEGFIFVETKFYQGNTKGEEILDANGKSVALFDDVFSNIAIKSGHHCGEGNLWLSKGGFSPILHQHSFPLTDLHQLTLDALGIKTKEEGFIQEIRRAEEVFNQPGQRKTGEVYPSRAGQSS